jgi:hypothetical protein
VTDDHREAAAGGQRSEPDLSGEWGHVADALTALAASIAGATKPAVDADDTRRRLRELSEGLVALSARVAGEPAAAVSAPAAPDLGETIAFPVVAARVGEPHVAGFATLAEPESEPGEPRVVLPAVLAATAKFRLAAEEPEPMLAPAPEQLAMPTEVVVTAQPMAAAPAAEGAGLEGEVSIRDWLFPEDESASVAGESGEPAAPSAASNVAESSPAVTPPVEPLTLTAGSVAAPAAGGVAPAEVSAAVAMPPAAGAGANAPLTLGLEAVRVAHERFLAERKAAEEAAEAALQKTHEAEDHVHRPPVSPPSDDDAPLW